jgi:ribosome biogenesis GTPase
LTLPTASSRTGRISAEHRGAYRIVTPESELSAELEGKLRHRARSRLDLPAVGDYVTYEHLDASHAIVRGVLPRTSAIVRKAAGTRTEEQVIASNVDTLFIVTALDGDFNLRRLERYVILAWDSGVRPVIVMNKADLGDDPAFAEDAIAATGWPVPMHRTCAVDGSVAATLAPYLAAGQTVALAGSSGVGKSTLANALLGERRQDTGGVRADDDRGRHTTTARQLFVLPGGAALIDTPGMRELQLWSDAGTIGDAFDDIAAAARSCRFADCAHGSEPACAVRDEIDADRLESYRKLMREAAYLERRTDASAQAAEKARWKAIHKAMRSASKS